MSKSARLTAQISRILTFSCVDGPGNRMVIFLQGCNFNCLSCHNPHTINHCNHCAQCLPTCPSDALSLNEKSQVIWDEKACTHCDKCLDICPNKSNPKITHYDVLTLLSLVKKYQPFLNGITVSGGEATLQLPFIIAFFQAIKNDPTLSHLSCFIDSNGSLSITGWQRLLPYLDGAMIDLKAWQSETHLWLVGRENHRVIKSIQYLAKHNKLHEVRLLHIPEKSDLDTQINAVSSFLKDLPKYVQIRLNAFQHHGVIGEALNWPKCDKEKIQAFHDALSLKIQQPIIFPQIYSNNQNT